MNIVINQDERNFLESLVLRRFKVGSHLYGTNNSESDQDILSLYQTSDLELRSGLPNYHQFQYKDLTNNIDWLYTSELQFWKNFHSGDSTINSDIILFSDFIAEDLKLNYCRTYKIIKAYLGFTKRDLKQILKDPKKIIHANRGIYCAQELLQFRLPTIEGIQKIYRKEGTYLESDNLIVLENNLRIQLNDLYDKNWIQNYYIEKTEFEVWNKLLNSNNTKEFKY